MTCGFHQLETFINIGFLITQDEEIGITAFEIGIDIQEDPLDITIIFESGCTGDITTCAVIPITESIRIEEIAKGGSDEPIETGGDFNSIRQIHTIHLVIEDTANPDFMHLQERGEMIVISRADEDDFIIAELINIRRHSLEGFAIGNHKMGNIGGDIFHILFPLNTEVMGYDDNISSEDGGGAFNCPDTEFSLGKGICMNNGMFLGGRGGEDKTENDVGFTGPDFIPNDSDMCRK